MLLIKGVTSSILAGTQEVQMQNSGGAPASSKSTVLRLFIAFVLGLPMGLPYSFISSSPSIAWWRYGVPVAVLVSAMLLSILLDPDVRQGAITPTRTVISLLLVLLLAGLLVGVGVILPTLNQAFSLLVAVLIPFSVGLAAVFAVGSSGTWRLALGSALVAWFGSGLFIVIVAILGYIAYEARTPGGDAGIVLPLTIVGVIIGFGLAALGGALGRFLRHRFLGTRSVAA